MSVIISSMSLETGMSMSPESDIAQINHDAKKALVDGNVPIEKINDGDIRLNSVLYMIYWFNRLRNKPTEQQRIEQYLQEYIGNTAPDVKSLTENLISSPNLQEDSKKFAETLMVPTKTVDLVITKQGSEDQKDREILCVNREYYPFGVALPGGIIKDTDEDNPNNLPPEIFAALRVAGEKVLGLGEEQAQYTVEYDAKGKPSFIVHGSSASPSIRIYPEDQGGYRYHENIKSTIRPSDPRHLVDTVGFRCVVEGDINNQNMIWRQKSDVMDPTTPTGGFAFGHHREIVAQITSQTSLEKERQMKEYEFIRGIIQNPRENYQKLKDRFEQNGNSVETSFPELFPVVDRLLGDMFTDEINQLCEQTPLLAGIRDKAVISLRQVCLKQRTFCPYLPTLLAIVNAVSFFDLVARQKKGFYDQMPKDKVVEHDPAHTQYAAYHMYRYKYRFDQMLGMLPQEIVIPTYEHLSATDLMKVRGVPIRFVGIATDFLYVDEFEQSPEEFLMHDANHSWRMIMEDKKAAQELGKSKEELIAESNDFIEDYLNQIKIRSTDTEEEKELKKLKKIILFEVVHEDARPFLKPVIGKYVQNMEGGSVPFEVPRIDPETGYMDVVDTLDTGISTLSYVRNKLQHGFYDHIDAQLPQIVDPRYRTAEWITKAAYQMLVELNISPEPEAELDDQGHVSYEWLMKRTCAVGPDNIHKNGTVDPDVEKYGDEADLLNPKRYQV